MSGPDGPHRALPIDSGVSLLASFLYLPSPEVVEIMAAAGLDAVVIDLEHGAYSIGELPNLVRAADAAGIASIVRVAENNSAQICKALDLGPDAVLIPQIESGKDARRACSAARYAPRGRRGAYPYSRSAAYSAIPPEEHAKRANESLVVCLLLEGRGAVSDLEAILAEEADLLFFGPVDLSHALGIPGEINHPQVLETISMLVNAAHTAGKATGAYAGSVEQAQQWFALGVNVVAVSVDSAVLLAGYRDLIGACRTWATDVNLGMEAKRETRESTPRYSPSLTSRPRIE